MHATARSHIAPPVPLAPARPHLRAVARPGGRRRVPPAATVALYAVGLVLGFLLAALASAPGGAGVVTGELRLAGVATVVGAVALVRARAVARRRGRNRRNPL
jgi:hypothetical protein